MESLFSITISYYGEFLELKWCAIAENKTALVSLKRDRVLVQSLCFVCSRVYKDLFLLIRKNKFINSIDKSQIFKIYHAYSSGLCLSFPDIPNFPAKTFNLIKSYSQRVLPRCSSNEPPVVFYQRGNHVCRFSRPKIRVDFTDYQFQQRRERVFVECDSTKDHWDATCMGYFILPTSKSVKIIKNLPTIIYSGNPSKRTLVDKNGNKIIEEEISNIEKGREKYYYWRYVSVVIRDVRNISKLTKSFVNRPLIEFHISIEPKEFEFAIKSLSPLTFPTLQIFYHRITEVNEETLLSMVNMFPILSCLTGLWSPRASLIEQIFGEYIWHPSLCELEIESETSEFVASVVDLLEGDNCPFLLRDYEREELLNHHMNW